MTVLTEESIDFAREHIEKYYDSDFFPKPREYDALWHSWDVVKTELTSKNIEKLWVAPPRAFPAPKPTKDFRIVHQLEPLDALAYTAMAYQIADAVEMTRSGVEERIACSYRISLENGSFFSAGTGYGDFVEQTEYLASRWEHVLVTDITDYYNQIYLHRLSNAIEHCDGSLKPLADDIEKFISRLNGKASQGIPVGPAASIVMAEAVLIDVDEFLASRGVVHTRYVDDFRIFSNSYNQLRIVQQDLTQYLYENHRLVLSGAKSDIHDASEYVKSRLHNQYEEEKIQLFNSLDVLNPYVDPSEALDMELEAEDTDFESRLNHTIDRLLEFERLDVGLARSAIRKARRHGSEAIATRIVQNMPVFAPVINDVVIYLEAVSDNDLIDQLRPHLVEIVQTSLMDLYIVRFWVEWYIAGHGRLMSDPTLREFVEKSRYFCNRARMAITRKDLAWVREKKADIYQLGGWERRALLDSARVLPSDERKHWLGLTEGSSPVVMDRLMAKWVRESL
jgi:hypothetical protein